MLRLHVISRVYSFLGRSTGILGHDTINNRLRYEELGDRERNVVQIVGDREKLEREGWI